MSTGKTIIVGSGLSGMMLARMVRLYRDPSADIVIVERSDNVGGQYGGINYDKEGYFDFGMHVYYESNIPEIDDLFTAILPKDDWNFMANNKKDIAGVYYNGKIQEGTPYVDLRSIPESDWKKYAAEIFYAIRTDDGKDLPDSATAYDILVKHYGQVVTDEIFVPIFQKLYLTHLRDLDAFALKLNVVNRVAMYEAEAMEDLMKSAGVRARLCYPNQLTMPNYRTDPQRGIYPKQFGMLRVMEKFRSDLEKDGVRFMTSSAVTNLELKDKTVTSITITGKDGKPETMPVKEIFWTAGLPTLAQALKIDNSDLKYDRRLTEPWYVNFIFDKKPDTKTLYHFFVFDKGFRSFRVTNFANYCPGVEGTGRYPVSSEFWAEDGDPKEPEQILELAKQELYKFGIVDSSFKILFSKAEKSTGGGFPLPSVRNVKAMDTISQRIKDQKLTNVIPTGVLSEKKVFFIKDVLIDTYRKVTNQPVEH